jgi:hypothetical protein
MNRRKFLASLSGTLLVANEAAFSAVRGDDVKYIGGTIASLPQDSTGEIEATDGDVIRFISKKGSFEIPYDNITSLEYGQKAGRRIGVAIALSPVALLSKKRRHFLSVNYKDADSKQQGVVLELPKKLPRMVITIIEARSGIKCEYESEEARKHVHG